MTKVLTLAYLIRNGKVCVAMKKRGFGEGKWNGYGGKLEETETIEQATVREIREESSVVVTEHALEKVAVHEFFFPDGRCLEVHTFFVREWNGEPIETEEMCPEWFTYEQIPYDNMWADDKYWFPRALAGEKLHGKVWFKEDEKTIERMEWTPVSDFDEIKEEAKKELKLS